MIDFMVVVLVALLAEVVDFAFTITAHITCEDSTGALEAVLSNKE
jgi:hypothetical protein